jgi:hypothetical protein
VSSATCLWPPCCWSGRLGAPTHLLDSAATDVLCVTHGRPGRDPLYASMIGLTSLVVLLRGLGAGLFIRAGKDFDATSAQANWVQGVAACACRADDAADVVRSAHRST